MSTNKYAASHLSTKGPGDARPTAYDILKDEGLEGKLSDKVFLVTGASAGIGVETVKILAKTGATVYAAARDLKKAEKALSGIEGKIELVTLDLASLASVRKAADDVLKRTGGKLNILVNNAGVMAIASRTLTTDGFEAQFGTNHLGHFLLFQLLKSALLRSSTPDFQSRVVVLSSSAHRLSSILPDDYNFENTPYNDFIAYGQAKTANLYMSNEIERRYGAKGLHSLAVHPGGIMTELTRHLSSDFLENFSQNKELAANLKSIPQGAATTVLAAIGKEYEGVGGKYLEDAGEWGPVEGDDSNGLDTKPGHAKWAFDQEKAEQLWKDSCKFVGVQDD
ncbi:WW domain-containing oxidoreductase [Boeremia exigua]|uniref:WW domain-containing oxidoreductase n=1 Tax=Boeremia exigua TaxID=749465 RepID=UPI001E8CB067|nr:WW domain-containing oxidoreductase [Boeremia exigua]KAH6629324.1 WW domain-containing oxidoreductase [Boeremia exigua]